MSLYLSSLVNTNSVVCIAEVRKKIQFSYLSKLFYKRMEHCPMDLLCFHGTRCCVWTKDELFFLTTLVHQKCNIDLYVNHIGTYRGHFSHGSHCHQNSWLEGRVPPAQHSGLNCTLPAMYQQVVVKQKGMYFSVAIAGRNKELFLSLGYWPETEVCRGGRIGSRTKKRGSTEGKSVTGETRLSHPYLRCGSRKCHWLTPGGHNCLRGQFRRS